MEQEARQEAERALADALALPEPDPASVTRFRMEERFVGQVISGDGSVAVLDYWRYQNRFRYLGKAEKPFRRTGEWSTWFAHVKSAGTVPDMITNHDEGDVDDPVTVAQALNSDLSAALTGALASDNARQRPAATRK